MRCREVRRLATAYVDGDLDSGRSSALRGHLRTCDECRDVIADESVLVDAAADLDALVDPPASLWQRIEQDIAAREIADSRRSTVWVWWQGARRHVPQVTLGVCAAAVAIAWFVTRDRTEPADGPDVRVERAELAPGAESSSTASTRPPATSRPHVDQRLVEVREANERYLHTIRDIRASLEPVRADWTPEQAEAFDSRLAEFERVTLSYQKRLAVADAPDPQLHDALFALYRAEIDFLHRAEFPELADELADLAAEGVW